MQKRVNNDMECAARREYLSHAVSMFTGHRPTFFHLLPVLVAVVEEESRRPWSPMQQRKVISPSVDIQ
jgi:hypothetical protein